MNAASPRDARAFGAAANFMPSRKGDKNNRCLALEINGVNRHVGHSQLVVIPRNLLLDFNQKLTWKEVYQAVVVSNIFGIFTPNLGEDIPNLTI